MTRMPSGAIGATPPSWVNGTVPVIATPGNREYHRANRGPENERFWTAKDGEAIALDVTFDLHYRANTATGRLYRLHLEKTPRPAQRTAETAAAGKSGW